MSQVNGEIISAHNLRMKSNRPMVVKRIIRYAPKTAGGTGRYRFAGHDSEYKSDNMSIFITESKAYASAQELGLKIESGVAKPRVVKKSCRKIGKDAEERCRVRRKRARSQSPSAKRSRSRSPSPKKKTTSSRKR